MIGKAVLGQLKQNNISKDAEKTKERLSEIWKVEGRSKREEMMEYLGLTQFAFARSYKKGIISAKMTVVVAEIMQINPFYLTGESDDKEDYSEDKIHEFLIAYNYGHLLGKAVKRGKKSTDKKADKPDAVALEELTENETIQQPEESETAEPTVFDALLTVIQDKARLVTKEKIDELNNIPEEELRILLDSLRLRAKYNKDTELFNTLINFIITSI